MKSVRSRGHESPRVRYLFFDATSHAVTRVADCRGEVLRWGRIFFCVSPLPGRGYIKFNIDHQQNQRETVLALVTAKLDSDT